LERSFQYSQFSEDYRQSLEPSFSQNDTIYLEKLWPAVAVFEPVADSEQNARVVEDILSLGQSIYLEVDEEDVEDLVKQLMVATYRGCVNEFPHTDGLLT